MQQMIVFILRNTTNWASSDFTICFWVNVTTLEFAKRLIYVDDQFLIAYATGSNRLSYNVEPDNVDGDTQTTSILGTDTWHHVAFRYTQSTTTGEFLIDGASETVNHHDPATLGWGNSGGTDNVFYIGNRNNGSSVLDGKMSHVHGYTRALSDDEVNQLLRFPGSITNGLEIYAPLWSESSTEADYSGNDASGTVNGATASTDNPPILAPFQMPRSVSEYNTAAVVDAGTLTTPLRPDTYSDSLRIYCKLDEDDFSSDAADSSGNGNDLTDNNSVGSVTTDYWNLSEGSADFEKGSSESLYINDGDQTGLDITGSYSVSCFLRVETLPVASSGDYSTIVNKHDGSDGYWIGVWDDSGTIRLSAQHQSTVIDITTDPFNENQWYHAGFVFDADANTYTYYLNGNLHTIVTSVTDDPADHSDRFEVGSDTIGYWDGLLKDFALWDTTLETY